MALFRPVAGDRTIPTHMAEGGRRAKAGQSVRLLDVPVSGQFDIEHGGIHPKTVAAYARSFAEGLRSGRIVVPGG